jgi:hypothetical protein
LQGTCLSDSQESVMRHGVTPLPKHLQVLLPSLAYDIYRVRRALLLPVVEECQQSQAVFKVLTSTSSRSLSRGVDTSLACAEPAMTLPHHRRRSCAGGMRSYDNGKLPAQNKCQ